MQQNNDSFLQPVLSSLGLIVSFITAVFPAFNKEGTIAGFFINKDIILPTTLATVIIGVLVTWNIVENYRFIFISLPTRSQVPGKVLMGKHIVWFLIALAIVSFVAFFGAASLKSHGVALQIISYFLFFLSIISAFAILIANAKEKYENEIRRSSIPIQVLTTMEKNGLVDTKLKIVHNQVINDFNFITNTLGLQSVYSVRIVVVDMDRGRKVGAILSEDAKELIQIYNPEDIQNPS